MPSGSARSWPTHPIDVAFLAMAASDYAPEPAAGKLSSAADELVIRCRRLPKLIATARDLAPSLYLVGFKLLADVPRAELIRQATAAGIANRADLTVANDLSTVRAGRTPSTSSAPATRSRPTPRPTRSPTAWSTASSPGRPPAPSDRESGAFPESTSPGNPNLSRG